MSRPCDLSATAARALIGARQLSPVELLDSCIEQVEQLDGGLNAVVVPDFERAREEAKEAEETVMHGGALGLLHGLPVGIKDLNETAGLRTTYGSLLFADHVPEADDFMVANLRMAGANVMGKTNTPEFGAGGNTSNKLFGATRNPFDPALTCGGSSGGSAVALATNMMPLASGSDTGGSLRLPAAYCGVVAHRGSPGLVVNDHRSQAYSTYQMNGPMARTVADVCLMLSVLSIPDDADPMRSPQHSRSFLALETLDLAQINVAISADLGVAPVSRVVRETFHARMDDMADHFASVEEVDPPLAGVLDVFWHLRGVYMLAKHAEMADRYGEDVNPNVRSNVAAAREMTVEQVARAAREQYRLTREMHHFLEDHDVLICPCVTVPPFPYDQLYPTEIDGEPMENYVHWAALTSALTVTGNPVVALPCGTHPDGTPFGLQVVGRLHQDAHVLRVARALEEALSTDPGCARPVPTCVRDGA